MSNPEVVEDNPLDPEVFEGELLDRLRAAIAEAHASGNPQPARSAEEIKRRGRERLKSLRGA